MPDTLRARLRDLALAGLIAAAALVLYLPVLDFGFVSYDDPEYVAANPAVLGGLTQTGLRFSFTDTQHSNWHPLTWMSHMFDVELFGADAGGHHGINALLHALNSALLYGLLRLATGAVFRSALVAALFALHPLHIESVAWISERKDVLSTAFGLLAAIAYTSYARRGGALRYAAVTLAFGAALLSKAMLVSLPFLFLLWDHWPLQRIDAARRGWRDTLGLVVEKLPWFAMSAALCVLTWVHQSGAGTMAWSNQLGVWSRVAASVHGYAHYLIAFVWPVDLAVHYAHPYLTHLGGTPPPIARVAFEATVLVLATVLVFLRRCPGYARTGWLWFLGTLVPVIGLVQVGSQGVADRYTYLPSVGFFLAAVWLAAEGFDRLGRRIRRPRAASALAVTTASLVLAGFVFATAEHLPTWRSSESLIRGALAVNPRNTTMWLVLGDTWRAEGELARAQEAYAVALEIHPSDSTAHANLARVLFESGERDRAIDHYRAALAEAARPAEAHSNLGSALVAVGRREEGIAELRRAVEIDPRFAEAHYNLGNALFSAGQLDEAADAYAAAIRERPEFAAAHLNLGRVTGARGDPRGALPHFRRALELDPDYAAARHSLERALAMTSAASP